MIQRREFIGSLAALGAAYAIPNANSTETIAQELFQQGNQFGTLQPGRIQTDKLNWQCDVVQTVPHNRALRHPVVTGVSLQPGGELLAVVGDDHYVCMYNIAEKRFTEHLNNHTDWIRASRFSPNGNQLVTAGNDRTLQVWNVNDWKLPATIKRHPEAIIEIAFSKTGDRLATVGFERNIRIYDMNSVREIQKMECPCADNHAVAFSPDDRLLAAGGRCGTIRVWDTTTWNQVSEFKAHRKRIRSIEFTPEGKIVSAGDDQMVHLTDPYQTKNGQALPRLASKLYSTSLLGNNLLATGGSDNQIHVWQLDNLQEIGALKGHTGTVSCLDYANGKLVSGSYDTLVRVWTADGHVSAPGLRHTQLRSGWNRKIK
jgi:WD40 repeat protein